MAPIKLGFIGLSAQGWAKAAHYPYLKNSPDYKIVALQNSSVQSSEAAIKSLGLDEETKAYGNSEEIGKDPNVELVVCSVRCHLHAPSIRPALKAGKDVYVEWPLARTLKEAEELLALKNASGVKNAYVGLQDRQLPAIQKIKSVIKSGKLGKVLSSTFVGYGHHQGPTTTEDFEVFGNRKLGGNLLTIHFGHALDYIQYALGEGFKTAPKTTLANRRPTIALVNKDGSVINPASPTTAEETIFLQGTLSSDVPISIAFRGGEPFKGTPALDWRIYFEKGEIRLTTPFFFLGQGLNVKLELHDFASDTVEELVVDADRFETTQFPGANIARVYQGIKDAKEGKEGIYSEALVSWEVAVDRHRIIEAMYRENGIVEE
ncbi:hypothetical protein HYFRA_00000834 [Hymenoscyphus fraxineus]|uniref:Oxidoreductase n=1 Tax=Hymenoscyphus fraxineus TaxID=746836 RepID=A0A9N9KS35_9HELO|nr:hypothetical protein HYFRA_00000834 [Hymenoscyphus fraxineus]